MKRTVAWMGRRPTGAQRDALRGFRLVHLPAPRSGYTSARAAWRAMVRACDGLPAAAVVVTLPYGQLIDFVRMAAERDLPVVQPILSRDDEGGRYWSGSWKRLTDVQIMVTVWSPGEERAG